MSADELRRESGVPEAVRLNEDGGLEVEPMTWEERDALVAPPEENPS